MPCGNITPLVLRPRRQKMPVDICRASTTFNTRFSILHAEKKRQAPVISALVPLSRGLYSLIEHDFAMLKCCPIHIEPHARAFLLH